MTQNFLTKSVFEAARERIGFVYDHCDDVIVSMSGGKDSTVLFELTRVIAAERGRLPLKVFWIDQEAEWKATETYMAAVMREQDPLSIKVNPIPAYDRFHDLVERLPSQCDCADKRHVAVLVGMRAMESTNRRLQLTEGQARFKGVTWCRK